MEQADPDQADSADATGPTLQLRAKERERANGPLPLLCPILADKNYFTGNTIGWSSVILPSSCGSAEERLT
jgi:hypothetical protein